MFSYYNDYYLIIYQCRSQIKFQITQLFQMLHEPLMYKCYMYPDWSYKTTEKLIYFKQLTDPLL